MNKFRFLAVIFGIMTIMIIGCSERQNPIGSSDSTYLNPPSLPLISLPAGAVVDSAIFSVYVEDFEGIIDHHINIHRITVPWDELTVTYDTLVGGYDPVVVASFVAHGQGWYHCDVTSLVRDWLDGVYPDYAILIEQPEDERTRYASSEAAIVERRPKLMICYTIGGFSECITIQRGINGDVGDAVILTTFPTRNTGLSTQLYTADLAGNEKQSIFQFDVEVMVEPAALGDTVWIDQNMNGLQDSGEPGFPDVTVNLYDCDDNFVASTTTDGDGFYWFGDLLPGDYYVEFIAPEGYDNTLQDQGGDDAVDSDADPFTGLTICTSLDPGEDDPTRDCGLYLVQQTGCTLTIGFWKNHAGFGPQDNVLSQHLPIWLGDAGGGESIHVSDSTIAHDILLRNVYGQNSNGITKLYAQMLAAKLNIAAGADDTDVAATIMSADAFLADHYYTDWDDPDFTKTMENMALDWMSDFDDYNNGIIGPGHCD